MYKYWQILALAFFVSASLTPLLRWAAFKLGVLDHPKQHGIHVHPVPRLGGVSLYVAFVIGSLYRLDLSHMLKGVLLGSSLMFVIGLLDDLVHLRAGIKLTGQFLVCGIMMFGYGVILDVFPELAVNALFTALGIIGLTNAINFLDNMDGLAAGLVTISSAAIFMVAYSTKQFWLCYLSMALVGATAGFLVFNLKKKHVFMGDAGSTFLGFTLASLAVMCEWSRELPVTLAVPTLILGVPILDMILITVLRAREDKVKNLKEWINYTGKDHLSHRFMRLGLGERGAVFFLWGIQAFFCMIALLILPEGARYGILGLLFYAVSTYGVILFFRKRRALLLNLNRRPTGKKRTRRPKP